MGSPYFAIAQYGLCIALSRPLGSIRAFVALSRPLGSIRALCRPISLSLHTGSLSPYFAIAPYGLLSPYFAIAQYGLCVALSRPLGSIRALCRPISPVGLNTGSCHPGVTLRSPRAVFWRPFRALPSPSPNRQRPHRGHLSPSPNQSRPHCGRHFPIAKFLTSAIGRCPFPIAKTITPASRASLPLAIYGEGVADRPG